MFPFDAPSGSAVYLVLLIATFAVHQLLIGFVLTGAAYTLGRAVRGGDDALAATSRDSLPFALGAAITAGVAPLLMVQVLYQPRFYTANLLLFHRWMAIVPVLIVSFYLLYLGKSERARAWSRGARIALAAAAWLGFVFVAWSWIENHALSMRRDPSAWVEHYRSGGLRYADPAIAPRLVLWLGLAALSWATGVLGLTAGASASERRRVAWIALAGLAVLGAGGLLTAGATDPARTIFTLDGARPWLAFAGAGAATAALAWILTAAGRTPPIALAGAGTVALVLGLSGTREAARVAALDPALRERLAHAQGFPMFVVILVVGAAAIAWCLTITRRHLR